MLALLAVTLALVCISHGEAQSGLQSGLKSGLQSGLKSGLQSGLKSGLQCYSCLQTPHPKDCTTIKTCAAGEECMTLTKSHAGHVVYEMGCKSKRVCDTLRNNVHVIVGKRATTTTSCTDCCNNVSLCNNMLCAEPTATSATTLAADTSTAIPTTTTTTPPATTTATTAPTTTDKLALLKLGVVPAQQTVDVHEMADFECNFDAPVDQPMNMSWSFMNLAGQVTHIYSTAAVNPPEVFIDVKNVSASDAGVYTCEASIGSRTWTAGGVLKVPDPNTTLTVDPDSQNTTSWDLQVIPSNQTMAPGETAILLCQFDPVVRDSMTMTWTFTNMAGTTTEIYSDVELSPSMTFYVKQLEASDAGVYTCQASYGNETWTANGSLHVHA